MGFEEVAYRGLETRSRHVASHVLKNGNVVVEVTNGLSPVQPRKDPKNTAFMSTLNSMFPGQKLSDPERVQELVRAFERYTYGSKTVTDSVAGAKARELSEVADAYEIGHFLTMHGQGVCDILISVTDVDKAYKKAVENGASIITPIDTWEDQYGKVRKATIAIPNSDTHHTLVQNINYTGPYLPGFDASPAKDPLYKRTLANLPFVRLELVDHAVENYSWNQMMPQAEHYANILGLQKFWSVDEQDVSTESLGLRSIVMASCNGKLKIPINEPVKAPKRGQIEEFYDFNGGPGVQHIALKTYDIVRTVTALKQRGMVFNTMGSHYYEGLKKRLQHHQIELFEDFAAIEKLNVLVDFDPESKYPYESYGHTTFQCNYILQIFTQPLHDKPTLFFEIIQRHHHNGFGKGTFKGLFESIEAQQKLRGTLTSVEEE